MANLSNYAEQVLLDWMMTAEAVTRPTAWYLALFTAAPTDVAGSGTEVAGGGYTRQAIAFGAASEAGSTTNTGTVAFTAAGGDFGVVTHLAIFDASSGGNALWHGPLGAARTVSNGDTLSFGVGAITVALA
jgi:hypothetical protein